MAIPQLETHERLLDTIGDSFMRQWPRISTRLMELLDANLSTFANQAGAFIPTTDFATVSQAANALINQSLTEAGYYSQVGQLVADFGELDAINTTIHRRLSNISVNMQELRPQRLFIAQQVTDGLVGEQFGADVVAPLRRVLIQNIQFGGTLAETRDALEREIQGTGQVKGLEGKIDFAVTNAVRQYDGAVNDVIATTYELNAYLYVGSLIRESRPQCQRWVNQGTLLKSELQSEINRAINSGSGMIPGTTAANFAQNRGGYNCRHQAIPIRV